MSPSKHKMSRKFFLCVFELSNKIYVRGFWYKYYYFKGMLQFEKNISFYFINKDTKLIYYKPIVPRKQNYSLINTFNLK